MCYRVLCKKKGEGSSMYIEEEKEKADEGEEEEEEEEIQFIGHGARCMYCM